MKLIIFFCLISTFIYADDFDDLFIQFEKEHSQSKLDVYPSIDKYYDFIYPQREGDFYKRIMQSKKNKKMLQELKRQMEMEKKLRAQGNG